MQTWCNPSVIILVKIERLRNLVRNFAALLTPSVRLTVSGTTLQAYVHGERIWLRETSEGDAERGGNSISDNGY